MGSSKKEIIYYLLKGVIEKIGAVSYGHKRKRLVSKAGISEIALYSAVASHIDENDINPKLMIDEMITLIDECNLNSYFPKTDDRYTYLRDVFDDLLMSNNPPEQTKFLCNKCYFVLPKTKKSSHHNYKHSCVGCVSAYAQGQNKKAQNDPSREKRAYKKRETKVETENQKEQIVPSEISPVVSADIQPDLHHVEYELEPVKVDPYITIKNVMADISGATIELSVKSVDLLKVLHLVDNCLIRDVANER